jgi:hypothetical protein
MFLAAQRWICFVPSAVNECTAHSSSRRQPLSVWRIWTCPNSSSPHYLGEVQVYLNTSFPGRWIGRAEPIACPPRSPDLALLDFFLWGFVEDRVFVAPLPANVVQHLTRIITAVAGVIPEMLRCVWQEIACGWDVCCITTGSHTEP